MTKPSTLLVRACGLAIGLLAAASAVAAPPLPPSGACVFAGSFNVPFAYMYGHNPGPDWGLTMLGTIDFGAQKMEVNVVQINPAASASTQHEVQASGPFTIEPGPIRDSWRLTAHLTVNGNAVTLPFNLLPTHRAESVWVQTAAWPVGSADGGLVAECKF